MYCLEMNSMFPAHFTPEQVAELEELKKKHELEMERLRLLTSLLRELKKEIEKEIMELDSYNLYNPADLDNPIYSDIVKLIQLGEHEIDPEHNTISYCIGRDISVISYNVYALSDK